MNGKIMVIDGNSILNRAFYGLQNATMLSTRDGIYTNAIYGFLRILAKYLGEESPGYLCVAFDTSAPTFRHDQFAGYKAKRKGMPDELRSQMPLVKEILSAMNIRTLELEGYEADDILGTISLMAESNGDECILVTGDKDAFQLASEKVKIKIPFTRAGKTETENYDGKGILEKYGVEPRKMIEVKALMGDSSDNIPGVPGIGEKTALDLIKEFGSIEYLYENLEKVAKPALKAKLEVNRESAFMSRMLAEIDRKTPLNITGIDDFKIREFDNDKLYEIFNRLELKSFIDKFALKPSVRTEPEMKKPLIEKISEADDMKRLASLILREHFMSISYSIPENRIAIAISPDKVFETEIDSAIFLNSFRDIFEDDSIKKAGYDVKNLITFLKNREIELNGLCDDIMIASYLISPADTKYRLRDLLRQYCGLIYAESAPEAEEAMNATAIILLREKLDAILKENNQWDLYTEIELPLVPVLSELEHNGFKIDRPVLEAMTVELDSLITSLESVIYMMAGEEFNIGSPKQLGIILFEKLHLPAGRKKKTGYSTNADTLEDLYSKHEIIPKISEYRQYMKLRSTYTDGLLKYIDPKDGKIHTKFNQTVAETGRLSSAEPNLQNIPAKLEMGRKTRKAFVPTNNEYILVDADYSQIELRVLAHISGDEVMIQDFINDEDIHSETASRVFGVSRDNVTKTMRSNAKAVNFGIVFGISDFSLSKDIGVSVYQARDYIDKYFEKYNGVRAYMKNIVEECRKNGFITTIFKRRRYFPEINSSNYNIRMFNERAAINTPVQGSAADIIKRAMVKIYSAFKTEKMKSRLILQVHDELVIEAHKDEIEAVKLIVADCMSNAAKLSVPLKVDISTGKTWYDAK